MVKNKKAEICINQQTVKSLPTLFHRNKLILAHNNRGNWWPCRDDIEQAFLTADILTCNINDGSGQCLSKS